MKFRPLLFATAAAGAIALPGLANAYWGQATGAVNMRTCGSTSCPIITVVPYGSQVWITGGAGAWYQVSYAGQSGFISASYVATTTAQLAPQPQPRGPVVTYSLVNRPPPPAFGYYRQPTWDAQHNAWYDGQRWYMNGQWYDQPPRTGITFGFSFGR